MTAAIPILIVGFRNAGDVCRCLAALARLTPVPPFQVCICENGGTAAFERLVAALSEPAGPCGPGAPAAPLPGGSPFARLVQLALRPVPGGTPQPVLVQVGEARENLGYAGGVDAGLQAVAHGAWPGIWVLNPDTEPAPDALRELVAYAAAQRRGMVGSRLVSPQRPDLVALRGLAWRRWRAATGGVDAASPAAFEPPPETVDPRLDSPSGASMYVTRACLDRIGPMDERYFLYFEDLDWGLRARRHGGVGYAHRSVVVHELGTTIGSATSRRDHSELAVYLEFRNRLLFVRSHYARWLAWTLLMEALEIAEYARLRAWRNMQAAMRGMAAGLRGETGRPDAVLHRHQAPPAAPPRRRGGTAKRRLKLGISLVVFAAMLAGRAVRRAAGAPPARPLVVLYYHAVRAGEVAGFARQMGALARWARVVPTDWNGGAPAPRQGAATRQGDRRPAVAITFDDAFDSVADNALPVLAGHGFACTIFVPTGCLGAAPSWAMETEADRGERVMSAERLAGLPAALVALGSHTVTHPHLTTLPPSVAREELIRSRQDLAALAGQPASLFAFPYGDHDPACVALCRACGYDRAFTIDPAPVRPGEGFVRGRVAVDPTDGRLEFFLKAVGAYRWMVLAAPAKRRLLRLLGLAPAPWGRTAY